jgi:DNA-binding response OmpR family regulator
MQATQKLPPVRILVVEDTADLRDETVFCLKAGGHEAVGVGSLGLMWQCLREGPYSIVLIDLGLPDGDGMRAVPALRETFGLGLGIVITTARGSVPDRVSGVRDGADVYMVKPVDPDELLAVVARLVTRVPTTERRAWRLTPGQLLSPDRVPVPLTGAEFLALACLVDAQGKPVARATLHAAVFANTAAGWARPLDPLLSRLRSKVKATTGHELPMLTYRNQGYAWTARMVRDDGLTS